MSLPQTHLLFKPRRRNQLLILLTAFFVAATVVTDIYFASIHNTSFYFSESALFSSYWLLFLPLLNFQWKLIQGTDRSIGMRDLVLIICLAAIHLICYPALVWLLSKIFVTHTFAYRQTLGYGLTTYFTKTLIVYGAFSTLIHIFKKKYLLQSKPPIPNEVDLPAFMTSMVVPDGNLNKTVIEVKDVLYYAANPPYVTVHHKQKKYLYTDTLKSLAGKLDGSRFVRIHKSHIVNIEMVNSYKSRLNGDYDVTLVDRTALRVSRNFAVDFKYAFENSHRVGTN